MVSKTMGVAKYYFTLQEIFKNRIEHKKRKANRKGNA